MGSEAGPRGGGQGAPARVSDRSGALQPVQSRGAGHVENVASQHRRYVRRGAGRRYALYRHGVCPGRDARKPDPAKRHDQAAARRSDYAQNSAGARPRAQEQHRPSRHQAAEYTGRCGRARQGDGFWHRAHGRHEHGDAQRPEHTGQRPLFFARAGAGPGGRAAERSLFRGRGALRNGDRARAVRRRCAHDHRAQARRRRAGSAHAAFGRGVEGAGGGHPQGAQQGSRKALSHGLRNGGRSEARHENAHGRLYQQITRRAAKERAGGKAAQAARDGLGAGGGRGVRAVPVRLARLDDL